MFQNTRENLKILGLPDRDYFHLPTSIKTFDDGGHFKIEIPTVNSIETLSSLFEESQKLGVQVNRVTETWGIFRHTKAEISEMVECCKQYGCEFIMSTGPRASNDTSATARSSQGKTIGYRLRGQEQIIRAIEDIKRGIDLGVINFLIYDEGLLYIANEMRKKNMFSESIKFKISAHCGHGNPASFKLLETLGADSINCVRDLQLPMIAALRDSVNIPLDCHTDNPIESGGFIRFYEAPEIVRIASPVYLKTGNSALSEHGTLTTSKEGLKMARTASIVLEMIDNYYPEAIQSNNKGLSSKCVEFMDILEQKKFQVKF